MKKSIWGLWSILAVSFVLFFALSGFDSINLCGMELKGSGMMDKLTEIPEVEQPVILDSIEKVAIAKSEPVEIDTTAKTILFIGDSMLEGLYPRLAAYAQNNGHKLYVVIWYSSTSKVWADSDKIAHFKEKYNPDYVFICLGANELFVKDILEKRKDCVKTIVEEIGDIPYVWIGPPNWKADTGINQLIAKYAGEGHYFKSDGMSFDRSKDGAHPTRKSAYQWMDSVVRWMPLHSLHPIKLEIPDVETARANKVEVLQPNDK